MAQPQNNDRSQARPQTPSASDTTESPKNEAVGALKEGLSSGARELSADVKHVASDLVGEAKHVAEDKLREGKNFAGDQLGTVAWALRNTSDALRAKDSGITDYVQRAATSIDDASIYLSTRTLAQLINDVEDYARREPAVFLGGAFFAGLLGGRFLKAAKPAPRAMTGGSGQPRPGGGAGAPVAGNPSKPAAPNQPTPGAGGAGQKTSSGPGNGGNGNGGNGNGGSGHGSSESATSGDKSKMPRSDKGPGAS